MSRKETIPYLRARVQRSGKVSYYLELTSKHARREVPLGSCLESALAEREHLLFNHFHLKEVFPARPISFLHWYQLIMVPRLTPRVAAENRASIDRLIFFFQETATSDLSIDDLELYYMQWRDQRLPLRARREFGLLKRILVWYQNMWALHVQPQQEAQI